MSLPPPPSKIHTRYTRLLAMQERGTEHEASVATTKIESLNEKYDFTKTPLSASGEPAEDLFSTAAHVRPDSSEMRHLVVFDMQEAAIGNFVKWVLYEALNINGVWRTVKESHSTVAILPPLSVNVSNRSGHISSKPPELNRVTSHRSMPGFTMD